MRCIGIFALVSALLLTAGQSIAMISTDDKVEFRIMEKDGRRFVNLSLNQQIMLQSPPEGLWSIATDWQNDWCTDWRHAQIDKVDRQDEWTICQGQLKLEGGLMALRDAYRAKGNLIEVVRRYEWRGEEALNKCTLSVRWQMPNKSAQVFLPGICYYGNPSGAKSGRVATFTGKAGEKAIFEEHRYPMPFAALEVKEKAKIFGAALHAIPSLAAYGNQQDQWWSLGVIAGEGLTELTLLSGPCAANGKHSVVKALQRGFVAYPDTYVNIPPGAVIEKRFFLEVYPVEQEGSGFRQPMRSAISLFQPYSCDGMPEVSEIVLAKYRFAKSRWHEGEHSAGFRMYPHNNLYVMGWAGQSEAPGYALLALAEKLGDPDASEMAQKSLDHLASSPANEQSFMLRYDPDKNQWTGQDPVSQGQAMENFARAISLGRKETQVDTDKWEKFLIKACDWHAARILKDEWRPKSTNEGFYVSALSRAYELFHKAAYREAALKAADHYGERHINMGEPYWGGTLDASCEDKEGAWAGLQAFLAAYDLTKDEKYLRWAEHACDVTLSYTVIWDIDLPPGRLRDHGFKSRGWTVVSAQNQHLDVYGVLYTPQIFRMGQLLGREDLKKIAILMFRSCGQLLDPYGSQGEQLQHTNFAQQGDMSNVYKMRGGYSEGWTVFWITAHFLNAAAQFEEMGIDLWE